MKQIVVLVFVGAFSLSANAADWVEIGSTATARFFVKPDTISHSKPYSTAYMKATFDKPQHTSVMAFKPNMTLVDTKYNQKVILIQFDCNMPYRSKNLSITTRMNNDIIDQTSSNFSSISDWQYNEPDSIGESIAKYVCS